MIRFRAVRTKLISMSLRGKPSESTNDSVIPTPCFTKKRERKNKDNQFVKWMNYLIEKLPIVKWP